MSLLGRQLVVSPKNYEALTKRYPKRKILCEIYCEDDRFYYQGKNFLKCVFFEDGSIWKLDWRYYPNIVKVRNHDGQRSIHDLGKDPAPKDY
jgi:hypothetical protein